MRTFGGILLAALLAALALWWLMPDPRQEITERRTDLPWQITTFDDGTSRVIDLHLGQDDLARAVQKLGAYEELALFSAKDGSYSLEAWFGDVDFGPLKAKVTVTLALGPARAEALAQQAVERKPSPTGDWKLLLPAAVNATLEDALVTGITYIPAYSRLDEAFFRERLGEPTAWQRVDEERIRWLYPDKGLSLLIDADGKDVFEYVMPRQFQLPADAQTGPLQAQP
jgi:hypothetical protein